MVDIVQWITEKLRIVAGLTNPGLTQSILLLYFVTLGTLYQIGELTAEYLVQISGAAGIAIFMSYMFGYVLLDEKMEEMRESRK